MEPDLGTTVLDRGRKAAGPRRRRGKTTGAIIVVVALLIAVGIVGLGFLIAGERRSDAARQRQIDERLEQIRSH